MHIEILSAQIGNIGFMHKDNPIPQTMHNNFHKNQ